MERASKPQPAPNPLSIRRLMLLWGVAFGFWTLMGLFHATQLSVGFPENIESSHYWEMVGGRLVSGYLWAFLTPGILTLARLLPEWSRRAVALHLSATAVFLSFHQAACAVGNYAIDGLVFPPAYWSLKAHLAMAFKNSAHADLLMYLATLGVGYAFIYYDKYRERELRTSELKAQLATAELQALKLQLNPHLLFNALHTIGGLIRGREHRNALKMLAGLSDLLRYTLSNDRRQEVPLALEIELVRHYLDIQKLRFSDRLEVEIDIAEETLGALVPSLVLQPLVENALRHGIGPAGRRGLLRLSSARRGEELEVRVLDRVLGNGAPQGEGSRKREPGHGLGLVNTEARLERLYGPGRRFELSATEDGSVAELRIPWRRAGGEAP